MPAQSDERIRVESFVVHGVSQFSDAEIAEVLRPYTGRELDGAAIHAAADALAGLYRDAGYFASRV